MKLCIFFLSLLLPLGLLSKESANFNHYFSDDTMRVDYYHTGDAAEELFTIDCVYRHKGYAGNRTHLIDPFNNGHYYVKIFDLATNKLIFSRGFDSMFREYQTTGRAAR